MLELMVTTRTVGVSGTVMPQGVAQFYDPNNSVLVYGGTNNTSTVTLNTTGTLAADLTATWDVADAGNTITCTNLTMQYITG